MSGVDKSKQPLAAIMHNPLPYSSFGVDKGSTDKLAKSFSETSLKSDESLMSDSGVRPEKNPRVPKRPPLLVSNQKYATILNHFETGQAGSDSVADNPESAVQEPLEPVLKKKPTVGGPPPPRPSKPAELRDVKSSTASSSGAEWKDANIGNSMAAPTQPPVSLAARPNISEPQKPLSLAPRPVQPTFPISASEDPPVIAERPQLSITASKGGVTTGSSTYQPKVIDLAFVTPDCLRRYLDLFRDLDADKDGFLSGEEVKNIWLRSGLDTKSLGQVWSLSDLTDDGLLDPREFCIGMLA